MIAVIGCSEEVPADAFAIGAHNSSSPSVAWSGTEFGVAWQDDRDGNSEIYFARVDLNGDRVGEPIRVTRHPASSERPQLVWTGSDYGLAWRDGRNGNTEVYFARLDEAGAIITPPTRISKTHDESAGSASLAWGDGEFGLAWSVGYDRGIYVARVHPSGAKLSEVWLTTPEEVFDYAQSPALTWGGDEWAVIWSLPVVVGGADQHEQIHFARINRHGKPVANPIGLLSRGWSVGAIGVHSLIRIPSGYAVSWEDSGDLGFYGGANVGIVDPTGAWLNDGYRGGNDASLVWADGEFGMALRQEAQVRGEWELWLNRLDATGQWLPERSIRVDDGGGAPSLTWTGECYGFAWQRSKSGSANLHFAVHCRAD